MVKKEKHDFKVVGFFFGGFSSNIYKVMKCRKCKKYRWGEIEEKEIATIEENKCER